MDTDAIIKGAKLLSSALTVAARAKQAWTEYELDLLAIQERRKAAGEEITMEDIREANAKRKARIAANRDTLEEAERARLESLE